MLKNLYDFSSFASFASTRFLILHDAVFPNNHLFRCPYTLLKNLLAMTIENRVRRLGNKDMMIDQTTKQNEYPLFRHEKSSLLVNQLSIGPASGISFVHSELRIVEFGMALQKPLKHSGIHSGLLSLVFP